MDLSCVLVHAMWSTKDRRPWIAEGLRQGMHECLHGVLARSNSLFVRAAVRPDHVHVAFYLGRMQRVEAAVRAMKLASQQWIKAEDAALEKFRWQREFFAFSVGLQDRAKLVEYLDAQDAVHQRRDFQGEVRAMLGKYELEFDERFAWQ